MKLDTNVCFLDAKNEEKKGLKNFRKNPFNIFFEKVVFEKLLNHPDIKVCSGTRKKIPCTGYFFVLVGNSFPHFSTIVRNCVLIFILLLKY